MMRWTGERAEGEEGGEAAAAVGAGGGGGRLRAQVETARVLVD